MMRRSLFIAALMLGGLALVVLPSVGSWTRAKTLSAPTDPAIERANAAHGMHFAGIDRWAYPGMRADEARAVLEQRGYRCRLPEDPKTGRGPTTGEHDLVCASLPEATWQTQVTLRLRYLQGQPPRVVAANAATTQGGAKALARAALHKLDYAPPQALAVAGWSPAEPQAVAALLFDRMVQGGWWSTCGPTGAADGNRECFVKMSWRQQSGFAPWQPAQPLVPGHVCSYARTLADLGFLPDRLTPQPPKGRDWHWHERAGLSVEEAPGGGWRAVSRWVGRDLRGTPWRATLHVAPEGGVVQRVTLTVGTAERSFEVAPGNDQMGCNGTAQRPQLVRLAPAEGQGEIGWIYWAADASPESIFKWYGTQWLQASPAERERILGLMLEQIAGGAPRSPAPRLGDMVSALSQVRPLLEQPQAWPEPEALERLHARAQRQPLLPVALLLMRCGAVQASHGSAQEPPDPACWREMQVRAPSVAASARQWLTAIILDESQKPVYDAEKRLMEWLHRSLLAGA